jgi:hypothetical protein
VCGFLSAKASLMLLPALNAYGVHPAHYVGENLSPCPTIWGKDPVEARRWVYEKLVPVFPVNVFRDRQSEPMGNHASATTRQRPA